MTGTSSPADSTRSLPRVAIIGSGISGLAAAHALRDRADITLFEAGNYFGGHTHTVDVTLPVSGGQGLVTHGVDTGFLVFNERTYPKLIELFAELGVATAKSDMSFSVKVHDAMNGAGLEWSGSSLGSVFAQRSNLVNPKFLRMLADIVRLTASPPRWPAATPMPTCSSRWAIFCARKNFPGSSVTGTFCR